MPYTSRQHRLFEAAARDPKVAKRVGIKQSDAARMASEGVKVEGSRIKRRKMMARAVRGTY